MSGKIISDTDRRAIEEGHTVTVTSFDMPDKDIIKRYAGEAFKNFRVTKNRYPFPLDRSNSTMNLDLHLDFIASQSKIEKR